MATEKAKERMKHFRSNISKPRLQNTVAQNNSPTTPTAPPNSIPPSSTPYQEARVHSPRSRSIGRQVANTDLPPPYTEIQPPINPYFNNSGPGPGDNAMQQNSSFNTNVTTGSSNNNNITNGLNNSQLSNSHSSNHNISYSSNNCSAANLSTLSQSPSSYYPSPIRRNENNSANTSQQSYHGHPPRSLYPNLNTSGSEAHQTNTPGYQQHLNELRHSVNRLSLGNDNQF